MTDTNYGLKDDIRLYWGERSKDFDLSIGHAVRTASELSAWQQVFEALLGPLSGRRVLELASGTGEISKVLLAMGADVTGIDLTEPMIERAKAKFPADRHSVRFFQGDAEATCEPDASYDAVACRHLVWTLADPAAAFRDWHRVLKPGGRVAIVDGDWRHVPFLGRCQRALSKLVAQVTGHADEGHRDAGLHEAILRRVYFSDGLRAEDLIAMLTDAGFHSPRFASLVAVERGQRDGAKNLAEWLRIGGYSRFALSMEK